MELAHVLIILFCDFIIMLVSSNNNSLNEYYSNKEDLLIVKHESKAIYNAIRVLFHRCDTIQRNLTHLESKCIINQYIELLGDNKD